MNTMSNGKRKRLAALILSAPFLLVSWDTLAIQSGGASDYYRDPATMAQADSVKAFLTVADSPEEFHSRLSQLAQYMTSRTQDSRGQYPPLPEPFDKLLDVTSIYGMHILMAMAEVVRDIEDEKKKAVALGVVNPLLSSALSGAVPDVPPSESLGAFNLTVFEARNNGYVIPRPSRQRDYLLHILLQAAKSNEDHIRHCAERELLGYSFLVTECADIIIDALAATPDYKSREEVQFDVGQYSWLVNPISYEDFQRLKNAPLVAFAVETVNRGLYLGYFDLLKRRIMDGELESDIARAILLPELKYCLSLNERNPSICWISIAPDLLFEGTLTPEQERTRDIFLEVMEKEVDATPSRATLFWISEIFLKKLTWNKIHSTPNAHFYGIEDLVRILKKIVCKENESEATYALCKTPGMDETHRENAKNKTIRNAVQSLCAIMPETELQRESICGLLHDLLATLGSKHPEWASETWFRSPSAAFPAEQRNLDDASLYRHVYAETCRYCPKHR